MENPFHTIAEVERISAASEPALRNLQITQSYYELSAAMTRRTGPCANWCSFATWASKQAGQSIRQEDLQRSLEEYLGHTPQVMDLQSAILQKGPAQSVPHIRRLIWDSLGPAAALSRAADAVARGNRKVYAEIGLAFARFLEACGQDESYAEASIAGFCDTLRPGDPPEGQDYLRRAFGRYYRAFFSENPQEKAQLMLTANLEIGFHEQTRLQPEIAEALEAGLPASDEFLRRLLVGLFPYRGWLLYAGLVLLRWLGRPSRLDQSAEPLLAALRLRLRRFLTDLLMELRFPKGRILKLGEDLSGPFSPTLARLDNAELLALLSRIDPTPDSLRDSGAVDWADLPERLHFIADLFRCCQEDGDLLLPPFLKEQEAAIKAGQLPEGAL